MCTQHTLTHVCVTVFRYIEIVNLYPAAGYDGPTVLGLQFNATQKCGGYVQAVMGALINSECWGKRGAGRQSWMHVHSSAASVGGPGRGSAGSHGCTHQQCMGGAKRGWQAWVHH